MSHRFSRCSAYTFPLLNRGTTSLWCCLSVPLPQTQVFRPCHKSQASQMPPVPSGLVTLSGFHPPPAVARAAASPPCRASEHAGQSRALNPGPAGPLPPSSGPGGRFTPPRPSEFHRASLSLDGSVLSRRVAPLGPLSLTPAGRAAGRGLSRDTAFRRRG